MQQDEIIENIENPQNYQDNNTQINNNDNQAQVNPLPEDLISPRKESNVFDIINLISYITLGLAGLFLLILYIIGLLK